MGKLLNDEMRTLDDETPPGGTPTPDQDVVDEIGKLIGLTYQDEEQLTSGEKEADRDRHRWELDPASAEDYGDRQRDKSEGPAERLLAMTHSGRPRKQQ